MQTPLRYRLWPGAQVDSPFHSPSELGSSFSVTSPEQPVSIEVTLTASGRDAIRQALAGLPADGEVWITSSVGTVLRRLSPCVAEAVACRGRIADGRSPRTRAVLLVHEWGYPHPDRQAILAEARRNAWRVVDDCAHALPYAVELAQTGAIVACSLPKFFPIAAGGLLFKPGARDLRVHEGMAHETRPPGWLDLLLRSVPDRGARHVFNWQRLARFAAAHGLDALDRLIPGIIPQVFRLKVARQFASQAIAQRLGIETTPPFYVGWIALPCHADLPADYWNAVAQLFREISQRAESGPSLTRPLVSQEIGTSSFSSLSS